MSVSKPLSKHNCFKNSEGKFERKPQRPKRGQHLLVVGLGRYKWYQSQTRGDVPARRLGFEGVDTRGCASKDAGPRMGWIVRSHTLEQTRFNILNGLNDAGCFIDA